MTLNKLLIIALNAIIVTMTFISILFYVTYHDPNDELTMIFLICLSITILFSSLFQKK